MSRSVPMRLTAALLLFLFGLTAWTSQGAAAAQPYATPAAGDPCAAATPMAGMAMGTPAAGMGDMAGMDMGSPMAGMAMEFDQYYIDMMLPHHASIVAMSQAALTRLEDERLVTVAKNIIASQTAEREELRGYRERFYGSAEPMPMDEEMMGMMAEVMPGMGSMDEMASQMDPASQVAAICAAEDADLAFIDLTIPHHEMAITASEAAPGRAVHDEIRAFAERVIRDQQREIDELAAIRRELYGSAPATPSRGESDPDGHGGHGAALMAAAAGSPIRALPAETVSQIERGQGAGFALPAERNGVPGPSHVLELADQLGLSGDQREQTQAVFDEMRAGAISAGARCLDAQRALEADLRDGAVGEAELAARVAEVSRLEGELATIHLAAHVETASILTPDQVDAYNRLRPAS